MCETIHVRARRQDGMSTQTSNNYYEKFQTVTPEFKSAFRTDRTFS